MPSDCLFCRIIAGALPSAQIYSDDTVVAIRDISPQAPTHILLLSRTHVGSVREIGTADHDLIAFHRVVRIQLLKTGDHPER